MCCIHPFVDTTDEGTISSFPQKEKQKRTGKENKKQSAS